MRRGVISSFDVRGGHWPQVRHRAFMRLSRTQSGSVISSCSTRASMPLTACSTYGEQSPGSGRKTGGISDTTTGIWHPANCAPPGLITECNVRKRTISNSFSRRWRKCHVDERGVFHRSLIFLRDSHCLLSSPPCGRPSAWRLNRAASSGLSNRAATRQREAAIALSIA